MRSWLFAAGLALGIFFLGILPVLQHFPVLRQPFEDLRWKTFSSPGNASPIVIIDIDESSLATMGRWPWSRDALAKLLSRLTRDYHAAVVGLDILLPEPDVNNPEGDKKLFRTLATEPIVVAQAFDFSTRVNQLRSGTLGKPARLAGETSVPWPRATGHIGLYSAHGATLRMGHITPALDRDGIIRKIPALVHYGNSHYPPLPVAMLATLANQPQIDLRIVRTAGLNARSKYLVELSALGIQIPVDDKGLITIPFFYSSNPFHVFTASQLMLGQVDSRVLNNALVLVGSSAVGLGDRAATPRDALIPGVAIHASVLDAILNGEWVTRPNWAYFAVGIWCLFYAASTAYFFHRGHIAASVVSSSSGIFLWAILNLSLFRYALVDLPLVEPLVFGVWLTLVMAVWEWWSTQRDRQLLYDQFKSYVPEGVLNELVRTDANPNQLDAQRKEITVLFADIQNFTHVAEQLAAERLVQLVQSVMTTITAEILRFNGTVDKYMGDAVMAFWGAPLPCDDHADQALECALAIQEKLIGLNEELAKQDFPPIVLGIGINSGVAAVGNMGSVFRRAYTALGDCVNLAARLQALTREQNQPILLGEGICSKLKRHRCSEIGKVSIRGKNSPLPIFRPVVMILLLAVPCLFSMPLPALAEDVPPPLTVEQLKKRQNEHPDDPEISYRLGVLALQRKDYPLAIESLERTIALRPNHVGALLDLAIANAEYGDFDEAIRRLNQLEEHITPLPPAIAEIVSHYRHQIAEMQHRPLRSHEFKIGVGYNSNVNQGLSSERVVLPLAIGGNIELGVDPSLQALGDTFTEIGWESQWMSIKNNTHPYGLLIAQHRHNHSFSAYDLSWVLAGGGLMMERPRYQVNFGLYKLGVALGGNYHQDGTVAIIKFEKPLYRNLAASLRFQWEARRYPRDAVFDAELNQIAFSLMPREKGAFQPYGTVGMISDNAINNRPGDDRTNHYLDVGVQYFQQKSRLWEFGLRTERERDSRPYNTALLGGLQRHLKRHELRLGVTQPLDDTQQLNFSFLWQQTRSNLALFDLDKQEIRVEWRKKIN